MLILSGNTEVINYVNKKFNDNFKIVEYPNFFINIRKLVLDHETQCVWIHVLNSESEIWNLDDDCYY